VSGQGDPPAGWYREPNDPTQERLWDGDEWRRWVRPHLEGRVELNPAGWRPDPKRADYEHLWTGEMWSGLTRPSDGSAPPLPALVSVPKSSGITYQDTNPPISIRGLGIWTAVALALLAIGNIGEIVLRQIYIARLSDLIDNRFVSISSLENAIDSLRSVGVTYGLLEIAAAVLFIVWFFRAYRNLVRFGASDLRYAPGWTIGGWFIPIFNFFRPKAIANDIWKGSAKAEEGEIEGWHEAPLSSLVNWWWGVWIAAVVIGVGGFGGNASDKSVGDLLGSTASSLRDERTFAYVSQGAGLLLIVAAVLGTLYVLRVSRMQEEAIKGWDGAEGPVGAASEASEAIARTSATAASTASTGTHASLANSATKVCPECAEEVKAAARVCRFCGHRFEPPVGSGSAG
jgi:hypothetical protein